MPSAHSMPLSGSHVPRLQVLERLTAGSDKPLTLIIAGAGFGKSILLDQYMATLRHAVRCDLQPLHADLVALLHLLAQHLTDLDPHGAAALAAAVPAGPLTGGDVQRTTLIATVRDIVRRVAARRPLTLVLDDYHYVAGNRDVQRFVLSLLQPPLPDLRLILSARSDPGLPVARLQALEGVLEMGPTELALSLAETQQLLNLPTLSAGAVARLHEQTEGWAAGLRLIRLYLARLPEEEQERAALELSGDAAAIYDYLREEVLVGQPLTRQRFLLESALLPSMTAAECDAILQRHDSATQLGYLRSQGLFVVPLAGTPRRYRYHHLFGAFLRDQAQLRLTTSHRARIFTQAAHHYLQVCDRPVDGLDMLARAERWDELAAELAQRHATLLESGAVTAVRDGLNALPPRVRQARPDVLLCDGRVRYALGDLPGAADAFREAAALARRRDDVTTARHALVELGHLLEQQGNYVAAADAYTLSNDLTAAAAAAPYAPALAGLAALAQYDGRWSEALALHEQALQLALSNEGPPRQAAVMHNMAWCYHEWGKFDLARAWYERSLRLKEEHHLEQGVAITANNLGLLEMQAGHGAVARAHLDRAVGMSSRLLQQHRLSYALANMGELEEMEGDLEVAESLYRRSLIIKERVGDSYGTAYTLMQLARLAAQRPTPHVPEGLHLLAQARALRGAAARPRERAGFDLTEGDLALARDDLEPACALFARAVDMYTALDARYPLVAARWRLAYALHRTGAPFNETLDLMTAMAADEGYTGLLDRLRTRFPIAPARTAPVPSAATPPPGAPASPTPQTRQAPSLCIGLLGGFRVLLGERPVPDTRWKRRRARTLLALLTLAWPRGLERDQILEALWPDESPDTGEALFYAHLRALRVALEPDLQRGSASAYVQGSGTCYALQLAEPWDGALLLDHHQAARRTTAQGAMAEALGHWQEVCALYSGPLLPEPSFGDETWLLAPREQMRQAAIEAFEAVATQQEALGALAGALEAWRGLLRVDDCNERAHGAVMRLLAQEGRREQALAQYQLCVETLRRELDAAPSRWLQEQARALRSSQ